jgi:hypothetical protein
VIKYPLPPLRNYLVHYSSKVVARALRVRAFPRNGLDIGCPSTFVAPLKVKTAAEWNDDAFKSGHSYLPYLEVNVSTKIILQKVSKVKRERPAVC